MPAAGYVVLPGVVDDVISTQRAHQLDIPGAAHAGDFGAEVFGELHGKGAHAARCAIDQHFHAGLDPALVAQGLQGGYSCDGDGGGLFETDIRRLFGQRTRFAHHQLLRETAVAAAKYLVTGFEAGDLAAHCLDRSRKVCAQALVCRGAEAGAQAHDIG